METEIRYLKAVQYIQTLSHHGTEGLATPERNKNNRCRPFASQRDRNDCFYSLHIEVRSSDCVLYHCQKENGTFLPSRFVFCTFPGSDSFPLAADDWNCSRTFLFLGCRLSTLPTTGAFSLRWRDKIEKATASLPTFLIRRLEAGRSRVIRMIQHALSRLYR